MFLHCVYTIFHGTWGKTIQKASLMVWTHHIRLLGCKHLASRFPDVFFCSGGGAALLRAGWVILAEAQKKTSSESVIYPFSRTMLHFCLFCVYNDALLLHRCLAVCLKRWSIWNSWLLVTTTRYVSHNSEFL